MADEIRATPRSPILGLFSDIVNLPLQYMSAPERTQQSQGVAQFLYGTGIPKTLERASYGESLFSGAGGLGGTTRMRPETAEALLNVAPFAKPAAVMANQAAMTAGRAGARYAERVVPQVMERGGLPAQLLGDVSRGSVRPLDVYHGTPHTLPPTPRNPLGEFDASKIGTGEGAQAYGYGIYTAEAPAVAKGYRDTLAYKAFDLQPEAERLGLNLPAGTRGEFIRQARDNKPPEVLARQLQNANIAARDLPKDKLAELFAAYQERGGGNLYKIDLPDEKIATMMDWDKPLSQQSAQVKEALKGIEQDLPSIPDFDLKKWMETDPLASTWHNVLARDLKVEPSKISELLQNKGVAGIKYLDELSRRPSVSSLTQAQMDARINSLKADIGSGLGNQERMKQQLASLEEERATHKNLTRNFVVFPNEEKSMTILERNGMPASQIQTPTYSDPFGNTIGSSIR